MFMKSPRTFSGFLWCFEEKSEYRGNHSGQYKGGGTANLFLGALATLTTISLTVQRRAFCANETDERKKEKRDGYDFCSHYTKSLNNSGGDQTDRNP